MLASLDELQDALGTEGFLLTEVKDQGVTFMREGDMVFCYGAFYVEHQLVVHVEEFLNYIATWWDADMAIRLDSIFQQICSPQ